MYRITLSAVGSKTLSTLSLLVVSLVASTTIARADIINWSLIYGDSSNLRGSLASAVAPPRYTVVPPQTQHDDQAHGIDTRHRSYRHQAHWQIRGEHQHKHPHEHSDYMHREIYRQRADEPNGGED